MSRSKVYLAGGWSSLCLGRGHPDFDMGKRHEFPKMLSPGARLADSLAGGNIDAGIIANFNAPKFLRQGHLGGFLPHLLPQLTGKPCYHVEAACASGGMALQAGVNMVSRGEVDVVFVCGFEIQNTLRPLYGADVLAAAADYRQQRKNGAGYFFPGLFSDRALAYADAYGQEVTRRAMARWYEQAIVHARHYPNAQEFHNSDDNLFEMGLESPKEAGFLPGLNQRDCSKYSDGASSLLLLSEKGLKKCQLNKDSCLRVLAADCSQQDICNTKRPRLKFDNSALLAEKVFETLEIDVCDIDFIEVHDCFSISGLLALEALGLASKGGAAKLVNSCGYNLPQGQMINQSGGLIGWGHPTGATGVRQVVDLMGSLEGNPSQRYGLALNMGGDDVTASLIIVGNAAC